MAAPADPQLAALRRQLAALSYDADALTPAAAPLVGALLADLVRATDSYRELKAAAGEAGQAGQAAQYQVEVLRREAGRLAAENARLHADLLREADARAAQEGEAYQRAKSLEAAAAEAAAARAAALEGKAEVERERDGLRAKVRDLLGFRQQHGQDEARLADALAPRLTATAPLEPRPAPAAAARTSRGAISLLKAADSRILALEADVRRRESELASVSRQLQQAQEALAARDAEIQRLSAQLVQGPDVDRLAQQYRNDANEAVILQLNQQVEALTSELSEVQRRAVDRRQLEAAQQAQREAEARANALTAERKGVAREVEAMQAALVGLQQEAAGESGARAKLGRLRTALEGVRGDKALLEGQLTHAEAKVAELRDRLEHREAALRKAQARCKALEEELESSQKCVGLQQRGKQDASQDGAAAALKAECEQLAAQLEEARQARHEAEDAAAARQAECASLQRQVQQLQQVAEAAGEACSEAACPPGGTEAQQAQEQEGAAPAVGPATTTSAAELQQQLAAKVEQLEQVEFERDELRVRLEESEQRAVALESAAKREQQSALEAPGAAETKPLAVAAGHSSGSEADWRLAAGDPASGDAAAAAAQGTAAARQQVEELSQRVLQLEGQRAELQAELEAARSGADSRAVVDAAASDLRRQLQERSQEVTELSALSIKADATVQQYMAQLRSMTTELRAAHLRLGDAETQLARRAEEAQRRDAELAELRGVVGALDAERDALQAKLDRRSEATAGDAAVRAAEQQRTEELQRALAATEARLAAASSRVAEHEAAAAQHAAELEALGQHAAAVEAEYGALRAEYHAVTDDLAALVKENQVISDQLASITAERQELADQVKLHSTRCHYSEQLARAREADVSELRTAYEGLAHENQRLQQSLAELTRELQARDTELATKADEVAGLHEAQRSAQSQINMYISDLQAYERQLEAMQRAMRRGDEAADGLDRERQGLLDQLRAAEQVRFQLERAQEGLQRQLLHAEGGFGVLEARLEDAHADAEALRQRVALEQARVGELEGLLAIARADQSKRDAVASEGGADRRMAALQEQRTLLEQQVATLQRQVDGLVQRREAQDEELASLRSRLAGEWDAGAASGSRAATEQGASLAAQLAEARAQCGEYAAEAEGLRAEAARLAGARKGAEAALAAAHAELEEVKSLLLAQEGRAQQQGAVPSSSGAGAAAATTGRLEAPADDLAAQLEQVQQENERLVELLAHLDSERTRLARELQELRAELVRLRATAPKEGEEEGAPPSRPGGAGSAAAAAAGPASGWREVARLEGELASERQRRQAAERDFQDLLASVDLLQSPSPAGSTPDGSQDGLRAGGSLAREAPQRGRERQAPQGPASGHGVAASPAADIFSSLQHIAQGLHSISSGDDVAGRGSGGGSGAGSGSRGRAAGHA